MSETGPTTLDDAVDLLSEMTEAVGGGIVLVRERKMDLQRLIVRLRSNLHERPSMFVTLAPDDVRLLVSAASIPLMEQQQADLLNLIEANWPNAD